MRKRHVVLSGKGGIGKSFVAWLVAQAVLENGASLICLDADPVNSSLSRIPALKAERISLYVGGSRQVDYETLNAMIDRFETEDATIVVDNGAAGFLPFSDYLLEDGITDVLAAAGAHLTLHTIVAGGDEFVETVSQFDNLATQFPAQFPIVLWLNPHHGPIEGPDGVPFTERPVYQKHQARLTAVIELPRLDGLAQHALTKMRDRRLTFTEALVAPRDSGLFSMEKARLFWIWEPLREKITAVL